jgi:alpha-D-xyloside xylohydrolase
VDVKRLRTGGFLKKFEPRYLGSYKKTGCWLTDQWKGNCSVMKMPSFVLRSMTWFCLIGLNVLLVSCQTKSTAPKEAQAASAPPPPIPVQRIQNGVQFYAADRTVKVQFHADGIVHVVKWAPAGTSEKSSLVVVQTNLPDLNIRVEENADTVSLASGKVTVRLSKSDGVIQYLGADTRVILKEQGPAIITPAPIIHDEKAFSVQQNFKLAADEGLYGLGQHQSGYMNYRGRTVKLVQANTEAVTPFLISTAGYGILWDNYSKTIFSDDAEKMSLWSDVADNVDYYFIAGKNMDAVIAGYRDLTGHAPMYGKWAYGYWQSKEHYHTRDELLGVALEYRKRQIPIDNLVQDWNYWGGMADWSGMKFDPERYPNPKDMVDTLHGLNFHLMISIWPGLGPNTEIFKDMDRNGFLYPPFGWAGFKYYDAYNPQANELYWKYLKAGLYSKGIDGWWIDSTEPDVVNALTKEGQEYEMKRVGTNYLGSWARYLNPFSLAMTDDLYQNLRRESERQRVYILTRSTFAGQQRAAATTWSGDIGANWDVFRKQISAGVNHSMAGIPYWTFDIGGFVIGSYGGVFSNDRKDPAYQELYTRMFQFGAFCPIFRAHGSETPREIWQFGDFSDVLVKFDNLRYRLMPYIYSLAWRVTNDGYTIMRGLPMDFAADPKTGSIDDQFMFGPAIMVCPVTEYMLHRPPEDSVLITPEHFRTRDGRPGLNVRYYSDDQFKTLCHEAVETNVNLFWYGGWPEFITGPKFSMRWEGKLVPTQTGRHRFHFKSFGPKRIFLNGQLLTNNYVSTEAYTVPMELEAGKEYDFACETANSVLGAFRAQLFWKTPEIFAREKAVEPREKTRSVYLPAGTPWIDFWTGEAVAGGQTIAAAAPVETMPLLVRAGSIIPMGPFVQYAAEKPADPIELRIYPGADGTFTLYEDENDNYNYEKGVHATITFRWDDARRQLTIEARKGAFPGMLKERSFNIVLVSKDRGTGVEITGSPDKAASYNGKRQEIQL